MIGFGEPGTADTENVCTFGLIVDSVVVRFGEKTVLTGGYITSETGMVTGLLGRNGAGKSCMFRALRAGYEWRM